MMKKLMTSIVALVFVLLPLACFASYIIYLKDGTKFVTDQYFEEGDQIKFKRYGGLFGIEKDRIRKIEEVEAPSEPPEKKEVSPETVKSPAEAQADTQKGAAEGPAAKEEKKVSAKEQGGEAPTPQPPDADQKAKNPLLKEFDQLKERFRFVESMSTEELYQFDKDLLMLRNKILKAGLGGVYADQLVEIMDMGSKMEKVLKSRSQ